MAPPPGPDTPLKLGQFPKVMSTSSTVNQFVLKAGCSCSSAYAPQPSPTELPWSAVGAGIVPAIVERLVCPGPRTTVGVAARKSLLVEIGSKVAPEPRRLAPVIAET